MKDMTKMTKAELEAVASQFAIELPKRATKAQMIEAILAGNTDDEPKALPKMHALREARKHYVTTTVGSKASVNCGDELAAKLAPLDHAQVAAIASTFADEDLLARYAHLNHGQIRMNCGNRLRAMVKRGDVTLNDVQLEIEMRWGGDEAKAA